MPIDQVVEHLVKHYPAHDFVISRNEAKSLGLPIKAAERYDAWPFARAIHAGFRLGTFRRADAGTDHHIQLYSEEDIQELEKEHESGTEDAVDSSG